MLPRYVPVILPSSLDRLEVHEVPAEYDRDRLLAFIAETASSGGAELANAQSVFRALCEAIKVQPPALKPHGENAYVFEEDVKEGEAPRRLGSESRRAPRRRE
jgi:hypothetical protein